MTRKIIVLATIILIATIMGGCFWNKQVQTSEVGLIMGDGVKVDEVVGAGRHTKLTWFAAMETIDVSAKTIEWEDPDLVTKDKQPIGIKIAATFARKRDKESILTMWNLYRSEAQSDEALEWQVLSRIPGNAKTVTVRYTLDEMLGIEEGGSGESVTITEFGREKITSDLFDLLAPDLEEVSLQLLDIRVSNIAPDAGYLAMLKEKANAKIAREVAQQKTLQLEEELQQEKAQTKIELEKAVRQNEVNEELAKVYELNPQYFELERLKILQGVIGPSDKIYFVPEGADLTLILGASGIVPVQQ